MENCNLRGQLWLAVYMKRLILYNKAATNILSHQAVYSECYEMSLLAPLVLIISWL